MTVPSALPAASCAGACATGEKAMERIDCRISRTPLKAPDKEQSAGDTRTTNSPWESWGVRGLLANMFATLQQRGDGGSGAGDNNTRRTPVAHPANKSAPQDFPSTKTFFLLATDHPEVHHGQVA